jgi:hypothetical protein
MKTENVALPKLPNIFKNSKIKRFIRVFIVLGIYNFDVTTDTPPVGPLTTIIFMAFICNGNSKH